jgi:dienelactone hydrolase
MGRGCQDGGAPGGVIFLAIRLGERINRGIMKRGHLVLFGFFLTSGVLPGAAEPAGSAPKVVWELNSLSQVPAIHPTAECPAPGMRSFFYEGADYKGKPTRVFAYYAAPDGTPPTGGWPAAVCSHGGGGTAYPDWVKAWNQHGYAAISMDLEGHLPSGKSHDHAGPARQNWFSDIGLPDHEQWFYHAVADVIRANSLLRSFPEINPGKIGLTGISWGGTIASATAGVDPRFAFVVPVYGCGLIHESDSEGLNQWFKTMTEDQFKDYRTKWDPSAHLPHAKMPMLWMTGFDDPVFQIDIFERSARLSGGPSTLCARGHMLHGHGPGWEKRELYVFADSVVKGTSPLPGLSRPEVDLKTRLVKAKSSGRLVGASLFHTEDGGKWKDRRWENIPCDVRDGEVVSRAPLPAGVKAFNINAKDDRGLLVSSEIVFE